MKCQKYTNLIAGFILMNQIMYTWPFLQSIYGVCIGHINVSAWNLPFGLVVPFDMTTLWGWYLAWFLEYNMAFAYSTAMVATTSYFVALCIYITAICDHFDFYIESNRRIIEKIQYERNGRKKLKLTQQVAETFTDAIKIHIQIHR